MLPLPADALVLVDLAARRYCAYEKQRLGVRGRRDALFRPMLTAPHRLFEAEH